MGLFDDPIAVQQYNPYAGILGAEAPLPEYDVSLKPVSDLSKALVMGAYESAQIPAKAIRGDYGVLSVDNPLLTDAAAQFTVDFGLLPAVGMSAIAKPDANTLRMGMGGSDTVSGGMRQQPSLARDVDDLGFYSQALEAAKNLSQLKGTGDQYRAMLLKAGVKPDEIAFTPELEGLLSQPQVTKDELVGLLQDNRIRPQEKVLQSSDGGSTLNFELQPTVVSPEELFNGDYIYEESQEILRRLSDSEELDDDLASIMVDSAMERGEAERILKIYREEGADSDSLYGIDVQYIEEAAEDLARADYYDNIDRQVFRYEDLDGLGYTIEEGYNGYSVYDRQGRLLRAEDVESLAEAEVVAQADARASGLLASDGDTRFMRFKEDGGENYREILLQVPDYAGKSDDFIYRSHFDEPNIAVHARTTDRHFGAGENGLGDALYVEELQSDWAQRGRMKGFRADGDSEKLQKLREERFYQKDTLDRIKEERSKRVKTAFEEFAKSKGLDVVVNKSGEVELHHNGVISMMGSDARKLMFRGEPVVFSRYDKDGNFIENEVASPVDDLPEDFVDIMSRQRSAQDAYDISDAEIREVSSKPSVAPFVKNSQKFAELGVKRLLEKAALEEKKSIVFSSGDVQSARWNEEGLETYYDTIIPKAAQKVVKKLDPDAKPSFMDVEDREGKVVGKRFVIKITPKMEDELAKGQQLFTAPNVPVPSSGLLGGEKYPDDATEFLLLQDRLAAQGIGLL